MDNNLMFSSAYDAWATPQDFFDKLHKIHNFEIDVCAAKETRKCEKYFTKEDSCFDKNWHEPSLINGYTVCFMNPPYGRKIGKFIKEAYEQSLRGAKVVCLLPARTDTKWFHDYCVKGEIEFIKGRLTFGTDEYWAWVWEQEYLPGQEKKNSLYKKYGRKNPAPFPSMLVIFDL